MGRGGEGLFRSPVPNIQLDSLSEDVITHIFKKTEFKTVCFSTERLLHLDLGLTYHQLSDFPDISRE